MCILKKIHFYADIAAEDMLDCCVKGAEQTTQTKFISLKTKALSINT